MGYARNFQPPSFFNPFSGYYGANTGMGGFQSQFGGFQQPQYGGFQQPQYGGFQQPQFGGLGGFQQPFGGGYGGGFQQPQYGGFQQPFGGGFSQPSFGNPFSRGFNPRTMPPQMQPQPMPQPMSVPYFSTGRESFDLPPKAQLQPKEMPIGFGGFDPMMGMQGELVQRAVQPTTEMERQMEGRPYHTGAFDLPNFGGGMELKQGMGGMPTPLPPETQKAYDQYRATRGVTEEMRQTDYPEYWERMAKKEQPNWTKSSSPSLMGNFNPMGGGIGAFGGRGFMGYR
jgi:hypothetical protein